MWVLLVSNGAGAIPLLITLLLRGGTSGFSGYHISKKKSTHGNNNGKYSLDVNTFENCAAYSRGIPLGPKLLKWFTMNITR